MIVRGSNSMITARRTMPNGAVVERRFGTEEDAQAWLDTGSSPLVYAHRYAPDPSVPGPVRVGLADTVAVSVSWHLPDVTITVVNTSDETLTIWRRSARSGTFTAEPGVTTKEFMAAREGPLVLRLGGLDGELIGEWEMP